MISLFVCLSALASSPSFGEANNLPIEKRFYWRAGEEGAEVPKWESLLPPQSDAIPPHLVTAEYQNKEALVTVVLIHDRGLSAAIWDQPNGGLAPHLWSEGYRVVTVEGFGTRNGYRPAVYDEETALVEDVLWQRMLMTIAKKYPTSALILLGHGFGGRRVYDNALELKQVDGVVALNIPLSLGGSSKALKRALAQVGKGMNKWSSLRQLTLNPLDKTSKPLGDLLLSRKLSPELWQYLEAVVEAPLYLSGIEHKMKNEMSFTVPVENNIVRLVRARMEKPILLLLASHDGWVPPWQCDPAVFGIKKKTMTRQYLTRANGDALEYNHLDMVLHPNAAEDIFPTIVDWLEKFEP